MTLQGGKGYKKTPQHFADVISVMAPYTANNARPLRDSVSALNPQSRGAELRGKGRYFGVTRS